jgi:hypothetical protein
MSDRHFEPPDGELRQGLPDRRELARLGRLDRAERRRRGERTRERITREQTRGWREEDRPTLRTRVWRELRDEQWSLMDLREREADGRDG